MSLEQDLEAAQAKVDQIRRAIAAGPCREHGHSWKHYGGRNAGCDLDGDCSCSVPVHVCTKCEDCDYGDNAEAVQIRADCNARAAS